MAWYEYEPDKRPLYPQPDPHADSEPWVPWALVGIVLLWVCAIGVAAWAAVAILSALIH